MILPTWIAALLLAAAPVWLLWPSTTESLPAPPGLIVLVPFGLGLLLLAITPFGQEFNLGTFSLAMTQPVPRRRIWLMKCTVLAVALVLVLVALCVSCLLRADVVLENWKTAWGAFYTSHDGAQQLQSLIRRSLNGVFGDSLRTGALLVLLAYAGGLWTTLAFRQMSPAFWFTLLSPMLLSLITGWLFSGLSSGVGTAGSLLVFILYAGWGFLWARRHFLRAQDVQWTGGTLALRAGRAEVAATPTIAPPKHRPLRALIRKEFESHYVNLLVAGALLVAHLAIIGVRKLNPDLRALHQSVLMILEIWWLLWLAMPMLVGAVAVAEERRLGTMEGHLCLPVRRRVQFAVKFAVVLLLGTLLGGVMPCLIEWLGTLIGVPSGLLAPLSRSAGAAQVTLPALLAPFLGAAALAVFSFYASTFLRNTLQALAATVIMGLGLFALIRVAENPEVLSIRLWQGPLIYYVAGGTFLLNVLILGYGNYKHLPETARLARRNSLGWSLALLVIFCSTTAIYNRVWEAWIPIEPRHTDLAVLPVREPTQEGWIPTKLVAERYRIAVLLPWGRLWLRQRQAEFQGTSGKEPAQHSRPIGPWHQGFIRNQGENPWLSNVEPKPGGRRWVAVAVSDIQCFALQSNGSLWDLTDAEPEKPGAESGIKRVGKEDTWTHLTAGNGLFVGVKADGSLWQWGRRWDRSDALKAGQSLPTPVRIGTNSDWVSVSASLNHYVAMKSNGSFWIWGEWTVCTNGVCGIPISSERPQPWIDGWYSLTGGSRPGRWSAVTNETPVALSQNGSTLAAVCSDGTLWVDVYVTVREPKRLAHQMARVGHDATWKDVAVLADGEVVAVRRDGTLWRVSRNSYGLPDVPRCTTLSEYSAWVAVAPFGNTAVALANDGKICRWTLPQEYVQRNEWLAPSRILARQFADIHR